MRLNDNPGLVRWLTACRVDIAHRHGWNEATINAWVEANFEEGLRRFNEALNDHGNGQSADETDDNGRTALEHAMAVTKIWAQSVS